MGKFTSESQDESKPRLTGGRFGRSDNFRVPPGLSSGYIKELRPLKTWDITADPGLRADQGSTWVRRLGSLCLPQGLPSGYVTISAPLFLTGIFHSAQAYDAKIYRKIGCIRNHLVMVDAGKIGRNRTSDRKGEAGFEVTEKGNTSRTMVHLSMVQSREAGWQDNIGSPASAPDRQDRARIRTDYLYFFKSYFSANADLSSSGRDFIYLFHPGHQLMCHFHNRPKIDLELLSYFALKLHFSQSFEDIRRSPYSWQHPLSNKNRTYVTSEVRSSSTPG